MFHEHNRGFLGGSFRPGMSDQTKTPPRQPKIGGQVLIKRTGYLYYISGGLGAPGNISAMTSTTDDYQDQGSAQPNVWTVGAPYANATPCNTYNTMGSSSSSAFGFSGTNPMVEYTYDSYIEHYSHKMCWGSDDTYTQYYFYNSAGAFLGRIYFYANGGYYSNNIYVYNSSGQQTGTWNNNYTGTHAARFAWDIRPYSNGLTLTQRTAAIGSGGASTIDMRGYGLNLTNPCYISMYAQVYSSYCQSCTADNWSKMYFNYYA